MMKAVILAGGLGTRLRQAVPDIPKPMAPIAGRPFLAHQMDHWIRSGIDGFILSVGYLHQAIIDYFGDNYRGVPVNYTVEDTPLGTGGGLLLAMERLDDDEPFLLLNGDTYFDVEARKLLEFHTGKSSGITFALFRAGEPERFGGVRVDADSRITELQSSKAGIGQLANGGIYVIDPKAIKEKYRANGNKISFEDDILPGLFNAGTAFFGLESHGSFVDIGVPKDYVAASSIMFQQSGGSENV